MTSLFIGICMAMVCIGLSFLLLLQFRIVFKKGTREMKEMTLDEIRHQKQNEKLLDELTDSVILHHASKVLRHRMAEILYKHIPFMDEGCYERGCPCVDDEHSCLRKAEQK